MPTYEYVCKNCGENFEVFQSFSDKPLKRHKVCGGDLQKVFHARGIVFKGGGFYATDSKSASTAKGGESSNGDKPDKTEKKKSAKAASGASSSNTPSKSSDSD